MHYGGGLVLCRKKGKLPPPKIALEYQLEYGTDTLEIKQGDGTAVIVDDVLATGGTMNAAEQLALNAGYNVTDKLVLINLKFLNSELSIKSLIEYE
jgi:adenine phosphoribosyltransferase